MRLRADLIIFPPSLLSIFPPSPFSILHSPTPHIKLDNLDSMIHRGTGGGCRSAHSQRPPRCFTPWPGRDAPGLCLVGSMIIFCSSTGILVLFVACPFARQDVLTHAAIRGVVGPLNSTRVLATFS
ncbi:hypothetical protein B0J13DRAFT_170350 [Dactylonectria estremocensis]|uniref:Uncharacterized protein n=1 Tax=Dactylonectria estremocensis TaxID=1079267 RepID=A0A9P9JGU7_9HYPO|nr:hypothetical protein B0J13DRAFT_170350 [Dactylonectria estremocensis]